MHSIGSVPLALTLLSLIAGLGGGLFSLAMDLRFAIDPPKKIASGIVGVVAIGIVTFAVYRIVRVIQLYGWA